MAQTRPDIAFIGKAVAASHGTAPISSGGYDAPSTSPNSSGQENIQMCREFDLSYPERYLRRMTVMWALLLVLAGTTDVATMRHVIGQRFTDAFGNLTTSEPVVWVAATLTLMVFLVMSVVWHMGTKAMKAAAIGVYGLLLSFLALTLWPSEGPGLKTLWTSLAAVLPDGMESAGVVAEAPTPFLVVGILVLATVATMPGLMFMLAKAQIARYSDLWRARGEATRVLGDADANEAVLESARSDAELADRFNDPAQRTAAAADAVRRSLIAFEQAVRARIEVASAQLASPLAMTPGQRRELMAAVQQGSDLLSDVSTVVV